MSSGVAVSDDCISVFQELKLKKKFKFIVFSLSNDNRTIVVEKTVEQGDYDDFIENLPNDECRYAVFDFEYDTNGEGMRNKICFYAWSPDTAKIKQKMLYAASKDALRKKLSGISSEIQGTDLSEVSYQTVFDRIAGR